MNPFKFFQKEVKFGNRWGEVNLDEIALLAIRETIEMNSPMINNPYSYVDINGNYLTFTILRHTRVLSPIVDGNEIQIFYKVEPSNGDTINCIFQMNENEFTNLIL